ncbi:MAG: nicotinate (nicotinamide) nucleotide adenylyltransferase [Candidatus Nanopelagicales bacterium]
MHRLGLLGGTFDPPHAAHLHMARAVLRAGLVDEVIVIPAGDPWQKQVRTPAGDRLAMTRLAFADEPYCLVDDLETRRQGATYAIDTVETMRSPHLRLKYIIGSDTLALLPSWHRIDELVGLCDFLVIKRPGWLLQPPQLPGLQVEVVPSEELPDASSDIRAALAAGGARPEALDDRVWQYMIEHELYGLHHA